MALDGDEVVGSAGAWVELQHNLENAEGWFYVRPSHRGQGLGRRLAAPLFDWLTEQGRIRMAFRAPEGSPFAPLAERGGAIPALRMRRSRLLVSDVDRSLMKSWIERAAERAGEYELLFLPSPVPEEHLEGVASVQEVMNEAPMEDFVREKEHTTPEMWRAIEAILESRGDRLLTYVARHNPSGEFVGLSNLNYQGMLPEQAWVWNTGVDPAHRNKGLGRWLKAAVMLTVLDEYPRIERMDTFNADSNDAMLGINIAMGFRPLLVIVNWQGDTAVWRERLGI